MEQKRWLTAAASCQGTKNRGRKMPCQDRSRIVKVKMPDGGEGLVAAASDGIGSRDRSGRGATESVDAAARWMTSWLAGATDRSTTAWETALAAALVEARIAVERRARREGAPMDEYACTLLLMMMAEGILATMQVGDGIAIAGSEGRRIVVAEPERGEFANETYAITGGNFLRNSRARVYEPSTPIDEIALMTDGMMSVSVELATMEPHEPFFDGVFEWLRERTGRCHPSEELKRTLRSTEIRKRTDDDTTLVLAVREE